jgi:pimeloyl-ACP methyl ester carboxylesterase
MKAVIFDEPIPEVPYTLTDMANDAAAVLDALGIEKAHVVGASMGGMIAQTFALEHTHRTLTLTSIMSNPGDITVGQPQPEAAEVLFAEPARNRDEYIASADRWGVWCSKKYFDAEEARARAAREYDRMFYPEGSTRQLAAIYASGNRVERLKGLAVPALVIHGTDDTLLPKDGGELTAASIPDSKFVLLDDMGHDIPKPLWPVFVDEICSLTTRVAS